MTNGKVYAKKINDDSRTKRNEDFRPSPRKATSENPSVGSF